MNLGNIMEQLTVEEKAALLSGTNFMETNPVPRLGVPGLVTADGPHGLRKQVGTADNGISQSEPATAFPTAAALACSWNPDNAKRMGEAIAEECRYYGVHVLLGPGINIKRNPLCGRNFEYFSEDPILAGKHGAAFVQGVQNQGVGVSVKHFAASNAENFRFMGESVVDERALRELYLRAFEIVVKQAKPATMMCAYNQLWGELCSENKRLLTGILREEWGFDGLVMTDWGAAKDRCKGIIAGLDLEMPGDTAFGRKTILDSVQSGALPKAALDAAVQNVLGLVERYAFKKRRDSVDWAAHHALAGELAADSAVLLKNDGALPLKTGGKLLVVGDMFCNMRYQGAGSSMINAKTITSPQDAFDARKVPYTYQRGYAQSVYGNETGLVKGAVDAARAAEAILFFGGLTDFYESEGGDRGSMCLPENQLAAIDALIRTGKPVVVVLFGGSPVELPFADGANAILNMYLPGQNGGEAAAALLFGEVSPSGKLAESWPLCYGDVPFGGEYSQTSVEVYREGIFVGYRYYATAGKAVRYPFGHGMSYTGFSYANLKIERRGAAFLVRCEITNNGHRGGAEVVQLYVGGPQNGIPRPLRELKGFGKVYLEAGETKPVAIELPENDLRVYDTQRAAWALENGCYTFELGASSADIRLREEVEIRDGCQVAWLQPPDVIKAYSRLAEFKVPDSTFEKLLGRPVPQPPPALPLHMESRFTDFQKTAMGHLLVKALLSVSNKQRKQALAMPEGPERDNRLKGAEFLEKIMLTNSPRTMTMSAGKSMPYNFAQAFVAIGNGHLLQGIKLFLAPVKVPPLPRQIKK